MNREALAEGVSANIDFPGKPHTARQSAFLKQVALIVLARANVLDAAEEVVSRLDEQARLAVAEMRGEFDRVANGIGVEGTDTGTRTGGPIPSADPEPSTPGAEAPDHRLVAGPPAPYRNGNRRKPANG